MRQLLLLVSIIGSVPAGAMPRDVSDAVPAEKVQLAPPVGLPIGNGTEFRARLLSWQGPKMTQAIIPAEFRLPSIVTRISSGFGVRGDPLDRTPRMHAGIDLPQHYGAPVASSAAGTVVSAGWARGYGNMVEVDHGEGVHTRYAHLSRVLVFTGQTIDGGQTVGLVGSTGRSTGNHLHFEVRQDGRATDPLSFSWDRPEVRSEPIVPVRQRRGDWNSVSDGTRLPMPSLD